MKKHLFLPLCMWLVVMLAVAQSQMVVITAGGQRTEYAITDFQKIVPTVNGGDSTLTVYSRGDVQLQPGARMVAFAIVPPEEFEEDEVTIATSTTEAVFTWPKIEGANTYKLVIYKDDACTEILMTLTFNREGYLVNLDLTGLRAAPQSNTFTITGLDEGTSYYYAIAALDAVGLELNVEQGTFQTQATAVDEYAADGVQVYSRHLTLVVDAPAESDIVFCDAIGRTLGQAVRATHAECQVQLQGVYLVRVAGHLYKLLAW